MMLEQTYEIDFGQLAFKDGDFRNYKDFSELVYANNGSACLEEEWITYIPKGTDSIISIEYTLDVSGYFDECPGDYWTPPCSEFCLEEAAVSINRFFIDDFEVELSAEMEKILLGIVEQKVGI